MEHKKHHSGLSDAQVLESRKIHGANILRPPKRKSRWILFFEKFEDPIIRILLIAAFLSLGISYFHKSYAETIGIFIAILLATGVAFWFELDANKKFDILNQVNDDTLIKVIRNGNICEVPKKDVVVGDIVVLGTGEEVPADGELLEAISLQIDESCLTGEPICDKTIDVQEIEKWSKSESDDKTTYPPNSAMRGTNIMDGHAVIQIVNVGDNTEYGKVAREATKLPGEETPLNKQLNVLAQFIGVVGFALAVLTFLALFIKDLFLGDISYSWGQLGSIGIVILAAMVALAKVWIPILYDAYDLLGIEKEIPKSVDEGSWLKWVGLGILSFILLNGLGFAFGINPLDAKSWVSIEVAGRILQYFMVAVTLIVVAVPEGLPMSVTLSLALSMQRMLKTNNLVRKMHACETMGAATVICTDKTGTLTQNKMKVYKSNFFSIDEKGLSENEPSLLIKEGISVNTTAFLDYSDPQEIKSLGNPTEAALLLWLHQNNLNYLDIREDATVLEQLTFSTERKYMATLVDSPLLKKKVLYVKGAPEIVLANCKKVLFDGEQKSVSASTKIIEELLIQYQNQAMRTLGFAYEIIEDDKDRFLNGKLVNTN
jgi:Ca2+-transporting ATPase